MSAGRLAIALALGVALLVFLQVPPLDSWRFHTVAVWQPTLSSAAEWAESPVFTLDRPVPARMSFAWDDASPAFTSAFNPAEVYVGWGGPTFVDNWWPTPFRWDALNHGGFNAAPLSGASGTLFMASPFRGSTDFRVEVHAAMATELNEYPPLTIELSQPYGYYYVPIEDYVLVAGALFCAVWYLPRYRRRRGVEGRRSSSVFDTDLDGGASCPQCGATVDWPRREGVHSPPDEPWRILCDRCEGEIQADA